MAFEKPGEKLPPSSSCFYFFYYFSPAMLCCDLFICVLEGLSHYTALSLSLVFVFSFFLFLFFFFLLDCLNWKGDDVHIWLGASDRETVALRVEFVLRLLLFFLSRINHIYYMSEM